MMLRQEPETVGSIVLACCCFHNLMQMRYPALQNAALDQEDNNNQVIPGAWRKQADVADMINIGARDPATRAAKRQRQYLKHYYNSPVGAVGWQEDVI